MFRKVLATFTAVTAALLVVGVAWASSDDSTSTSITTAGTTATSGDSTVTSVDATSSTSIATADSSTSTTSNASTSTSNGASTSTSSDDSDDTRTTVTTVASTTSTSAGQTTSTSIDDNDDRVPADGRSTHVIAGVGSVTIAVAQGRLSLVDVSAPGWVVELDKVENDRIEIEFTLGEAEAEFEARIRGDHVDVEIEFDSD